MAEKKVKLPTMVTPPGIAQYAWLDKPDNGFDGKGADTYKCTVLVEDNEVTRAWCAEVSTQALAHAKEHKIPIKKKHHVPYILPEDIGEEDFEIAEGKEKPKYSEEFRGKIIIAAKSGYKPGLIDKAKEALPEGTKVMSGDTVRLKVALNPYEGLGSGISLRLAVVQLIKKSSSFQAGKVNTDGFDDESDDDGIPF
jgi:hypothetical protein